MQTVQDIPRQDQVHEWTEFGSLSTGLISQNEHSLMHEKQF